MPSTNYIVRDIVQYVHDENEYKRSFSLSKSIKKLKSNILIFIVIISLSLLCGYLSVYLPSILEHQKQIPEYSSQTEMPSEMKGKLESLSQEEKEILIKELTEKLKEQK
jgi:hypothetical protein